MRQHSLRAALALLLLASVLDAASAGPRRIRVEPEPGERQARPAKPPAPAASPDAAARPEATNRTGGQTSDKPSQGQLFDCVAGCYGSK